MDGAIIDTLYQEFKGIAELLERGGEISLRSAADNTFRKVLLLSAASFFEDRITTEIVSFCTERAGRDEMVASFVKNKAISRQYHTLFDWDKRNANKFFGLFGEGFLEFMKAEVDGSEDLRTAIEAFLVIGDERNRLVHTNFAALVMEKTADEIYQLYQQALRFVVGLSETLRKYGRRGAHGVYRGTYTPPPISGIGWGPFRYPPT